MTMLRKAIPHLLKRLLPRTATAILVATLIALPAGAGTAIAVTSTGDTSAVAINTKDGSSVFKLTFAVRQVSGSVMAPQNAAVAVSSCANCQTVAISVEVALASGDPTTVSPVNEAVAINENCTSCDTLAAAYQFVYALDTKLKLTAEGRQQLAYIRQQLEQLRNSGLTSEQIYGQVSDLMHQLSNVLNTQLIGVTQPAAGPGAGTATTTTTTSPDTTAALPSMPADAATPTSAPTDTTTSPTSAPTDTTSSGTGTGTTPGSSASTPTSATTSTPTTTTGTTPTTTPTTTTTPATTTSTTPTTQ